MDVQNYELGEAVVSIDFDDEGNLIEYEPEQEENNTEEIEEDLEEGFQEEAEENEEEVNNNIEETQTSEAEDKENTGEEDEEDNPFSVFASNLIENEVLVGLGEGETIESEEDLVNHISKTRDFIVEDVIKEANSKSYGAVDFFLNGGTPEEFAKTFSKQEASLPSYKEEDFIDNEVARKKVAEAYYKAKGFQGKRLQKQVTNSVDLDEESDFLEMQEELAEVDKSTKENFAKVAKEKEAAKLKQQQEFNKSLEDNTLNVTEFIPGRKIEKKTKEKVLTNIPETWNKINKDLTKYAPMLAYLDYYGLLEGNFDKVMKEAKTKETSKLTEVLKKTNIARKGDRKVKTTKEEEETKRILKNSVRGV